MRYPRPRLCRSLTDAVLFAVLTGCALLSAGRPCYGAFLPLAQQATLTASDPVTLAMLGSSVAISGDTVVGGAPNFTDPGAAYVFVRNGIAWSQQQKLTSDNARTGFGWSVAISGDTLVVGSPFDTDGSTQRGAAFVFVRQGTSWSLQQKLTASDGRSNGFFGFAVAISGETIMVGAFGASDGANPSGAAYIFVRNATTWSEQQKLVPTDGGSGFFGQSVALADDTAAIGDPAFVSSSVYVFGRSGSTWSQSQKLKASDAEAATNFGSSVALAGDRLVAGAPFDATAGNRAGSAYVFAKSGAGWLQEQKLLPADLVPPGDVFGKTFGDSVAVSGETILIGALYDNTGRGAAYVFGFDGTSWSQRQKLIDFSLTSLGLSVAMSGETAAIGSNFGGQAYGAVSIYEPVSNHPPVADAGPDQSVECTSPSGAGVRLDGTRSSDPDHDPLTFDWSDPFGHAVGASPLLQFPLGSTAVTLTVADGHGATASDSVQIHVLDTTPPDLSNLTAHPTALWPPNHKMVPVSLSVDTFDRCDGGARCAIETVTANEPITGDFSLTGPLQLELRAERQGSGAGRIYSIVVGCQDAFGNTSRGTVEVRVSHDQGHP